MHIKLIMLVLLFYSLVPLSISKAYLNIRLGGLPISYIPFILIYIVTLLKVDLNHTYSKKLFLSLKWLIIWLIIALLSFVINFITRDSFDLISFSIDFIMIFFYIFVGYLGQVLYLTKRCDEQQLEAILITMIKVLSLIVVVGSIRFFIFDRNEALFFNFFHPLNYRLFEVLLLIFVTPVSIGYYLKTKSSIALLYVLILISGVFVSGSRTGYVTLSLLIPIMLYTKDITIVGLLKSLLPLMIIGAVILFDEDIQRNLQRLDMIKHYFDLNFESAVEDNQVVRRVGMIAGSKEMILNNPFFGVGLGKENYFSAFPKFYLDYFHVGRPHNQYLSLAASTGLLGLLAFLMFFYSIVIQGKQTLKTITKKHSSYYLVKYLLVSNALLFVLMIGYEFETEPFIWLIWAITTSFFYIVKKNHYYLHP